jgi:hypothetical protein
MTFESQHAPEDTMQPNEPDIWAIISALGTFASGLGTVVLVGLALKGLNQWRAQLQGTTRYDLARRLAMLTLQFENEFSQARSPFTFPSESAGRPKVEGESESIAGTNNEYYARLQRLKPLSETMQKLTEAGWEAEIILGEDAPQFIQPFEECYRELAVGIRAHFENERRHAGRSQLSEAVYARQEELSNKVYYSGTGDTLSKKTHDATLAMKRYVQQFIK